MKIKMKELSPGRFPWSRYEGGTIPNPLRHSVSEQVKWLSKQNIVGYCEGLKLEVRPRDHAVGILIDDAGYETWAHLDIIVFEEYQKGAE